MKTYQDLSAVGENEQARIGFALAVINEHRTSPAYRTAVDAEMYYRHLNPTIMRAQKFVYDALGRAQPDIYSANHKIPCRWYFYFVTQATQFLLGNGVSFSDADTKAKLGAGFDEAVQKAAVRAMNGGVSFGFWNVDHLEVFALAGGDEPSFAPLYDEENGALRAGVRFWQIAPDKPLRFTLYEEDGFTEYIRRPGEDPEVLQEKRDYIQIAESSGASGLSIYNGGNWPGFPIVPLFNINSQSELVGARETLDAYDLMASALVNNVDDGNLIYWILKNCGGMDDLDDQRFIEKLRSSHVAHADGSDGSGVEPHTVEAPFEANEAALERLRAQLFEDFMALDVKNIASGAVTATQILAAYEPLNARTDLFEGQVTRFIRGILELIGVDDMPTYTRSVMVNKQEEISVLAQAAQWLSAEYVTRKVLELEGDIDKAEDVLREMGAEDMDRSGFGADE